MGVFGVGAVSGLTVFLLAVVRKAEVIGLSFAVVYEPA
jgi:hypothetical protein